MIEKIEKNIRFFQEKPKNIHYPSSLEDTGYAIVTPHRYEEKPSDYLMKQDEIEINQQQSLFSDVDTPKLLVTEAKKKFDTIMTFLTERPLYTIDKSLTIAKFDDFDFDYELICSSPVFKNTESDTDEE